MYYLALLAFLAAEPSVSSTRQSAYDYQAQRSDGTVTNHQRPEIAAFACANWLFANPTGTCAVQGGKWSIAVTLPDVVSPPPPPTNIAEVSWTAPTTNTDGTPLTDLAGYYVYTGTSPDALTRAVTTGQLAHTFTNLPSGTHYFAVSVFNEAGVESERSGVGSKTIP